MSTIPGSVPSPAQLAERIGMIRGRFEKAWQGAGPQGHKRPNLEKYLAGVQGPARLALLAELVALDVAFRRQLGEQPALADYQASFPDAGEALVGAFGGDATMALAPSVAEAAPAAAEQPAIPGYEILSVLGRGGMGVVYKARHQKLKRLVALKVILAAEHAGADQMLRFRAEAEAIARLQHANIVQLYEFGEHAGKPYLTLEFVEGGSLDKWLQGTPLPPRQAAALVISLAEAMAYAHQHGLVHRDLKPANILLTARGMPKITDFGLVKRLDDDSGATATGAILGTPSYMAPEQAHGHGNMVGPAADIYALGAILYELLTGRPPYRGAAALDTLLQVLTNEPAAPRALQPKVSRDLETICLKCLSKDSRRRYLTATALAQDLRRFLKGEPITARPVSLGERLLKWAWRRPAAAALIVLAVLSLLAVLAGGAWFAGHEHDQHLLADQLRGQAEDARQKAELAEKAALERATAEAQARRQTQVQLAKMAMMRGQALCEDGDFSRGMVWLAHSLQLVPQSQFPYEQAARLQLDFCRQSASPLKLCLDHIGYAVFSPDGQQLAAVSGKEIQLLDAATGELLNRKPMQHDKGIRLLAFSPNGQTLVSAGGDHMVCFWNPATGEEITRKETSEDIRCLAFFPDSKSLVIGVSSPYSPLDNRALLQRWEVPSGRVLRSITLDKNLNGPVSVSCSVDNHTVLTGMTNGPGACLWDLQSARDTFAAEVPLLSRATAVAFSADGKTFLTGTDEGKAQRWHCNPVSAAGPPFVHAGAVRVVAFSPTGGSVASASQDGRVYLWNPATGQRRGQPLSHPGAVRCAAFGKDGKTILTVAADSRLRLWTLRGGPALWRTVNFPWTWAVAFRPDGKQFVCRTGGDNVFDNIRATATGAVVGQPLPSHFAGGCVAWSADTKTIVTGFWHGQGAKLWNADNPQQLAKVLHQGADVNRVAFSPDGKMVVTAGSDLTVRRWYVATGKPWGAPFPFAGALSTLAFSQDGKLLLTAGSNNKTAKLWDALALTDPLRKEFSHPAVLSTAALSPDGLIVATAAGNSVRLWDVATGQVRGTALPHQAAIRALAFSPDSRTLATASQDRMVRLWHAATGSPLSPVLEQSAEVTMLHFSPNGRILVTAGDFPIVRLLDAVSGQPVSPPLRHQAAVDDAVMSPDGRKLLVSTRGFTQNRQSELCLWKVPSVMEGSVERLVLWTQVATGMELDTHDEVRALGGDAWQKCRQRLQELGGPP